MNVLVGSTEASLTFVDDEEIVFTNGIASCTPKQKKVLLKKKGYYDPDKVSKEQVMNEGGVTTLELVYQKMVREGELPVLKKWLTEKLSEVEPALLTMQQNAGPNMEPPTPEPVEVDEEDEEDDLDVNVDQAGVDGTEIELDGKRMPLSEMMENMQDNEDDEEEDPKPKKKKKGKKGKKKRS